MNLERRILNRKIKRKAKKYFKWLMEGRAVLQGKSKACQPIGEGYWVFLDSYTNTTLYLPIEGSEHFGKFLKGGY